MLSKQQKQKYGQILRQQMKEKQQRKKVQDMQKRGNVRQLQPPRQQPPQYKPTIVQKQNSYQRQFIDPKQELQKKLQTQQYNYFGGSGGGAPNRRVPEQNVTNLRNMSQPNNLRLGAEQMMQYSGNNKQYQNQYTNQPQQRVRTLSQEQQYYQGQGMQNPLESISPQSINYPRQQQTMYYQEGGISSGPQGRLPNPYQQQSTQNYQAYNNSYGNNRQQQRQPISYEYIPENTKQNNSRLQEFPPNNPYMQQQNYQPTMNQNQLMTQQKPGSYQSPQISQPQMQNQMQYQMMQDPANQELQEVFKKGGRNLLKLQNQTIDEHLVKQKRKLQIQKQLKQQIQQAERRKKQQKQRLKREQEEQERKHVAYLAEQKRKIDDEQRKNRQAKQKIIDDNLRNIQQKKQMEEQAKRKVERQRQQKERRQNQAVRHKDQIKRQQQQIQRQNNRKPPQQFINQDPRPIQKNSGRITEDDNTSVVSSETSQMEKGFNTAVSKEFFRKQRQRNNPSTSANNQHFQKVTSEIQKMNYQLSQQRRQIQKIIQEKDRAQIDKKKADEQIDRLKRQLKRKMEDDNGKLLRALQGDYKDNDFNRLPPQHYRNLNQYEAPPEQYENQYPTFSKKPMRQRQQQNLIQREYEPQPAKYIPREQETNQFEQSNVGLISLDGDSKKIPLFLEHSNKLTMSQVQNFAKDSAYFQKGGMNGMHKNSPPKQKYNTRINESIVEEADEDRDYANNNSRKSNRNKQSKKQSSLYKQQKDELDKLIDSRAKSRGGWGELSSVNSDITKEIDELLKRKQNGMGGNNNGRPNSISNAGKQSLSKQGYAYDGLTLNSNVGGTLGTNGTLDLDRINGRNDARLRQLKNLGVQTINTNGDDDLNALDQLLNKYK